MTREELTLVRHLKNCAARLEKQLRSLKFLTVSVSNLSEPPVSRNWTSKVESITVRLLDTQSELDELNARILQEKKILLEKILEQADDPLDQTILILCYVECVSFRQAARQLNFSLRQIYRLHDNAVKVVTPESRESRESP